ncbi:putative Zinc finger, FYVE/PHD-type, Zinc finger, RING/FYVE/PHD-type [Septoria linicola]|nr:putative Zinc finger, FYVE/PHD-type, Zinc finger, RING/FYVE/PHD-type [Septoria linicola]
MQAFNDRKEVRGAREAKTSGQARVIKPKETRRPWLSKNRYVGFKKKPKKPYHQDSAVKCEGRSCLYRSSGPSTPPKTITCANEKCTIKTYHKKCVGRDNAKKYPNDLDWRCRACRVVSPKLKRALAGSGQCTLNVAGNGWQLTRQ